MSEQNRSTPIDAFIFDLGKVIVDWNPAYLLAEIAPDDNQLKFLVEEVLDLDWFRAVDAGYPLSRAIAERSILFPDHAEALRLYVERWPETINGLFDDVVEIVEELRKARFPLFVLSNWASETWARVHADFDFLRHFDDIIISGHVGVAKPDHAIFEIAKARFGVDPPHTLFIDDGEVNVTAARECGFQAFLFRDAIELRDLLAARGILAE